jgi:hypothetical protein
MGRHSYAASHCEDIISYSDEVLSPERKEFMAHDILITVNPFYTIIVIITGSRVVAPSFRRSLV